METEMTETIELEQFVFEASKLPFDEKEACQIFAMFEMTKVQNGTQFQQFLVIVGHCCI